MLTNWYLILSLLSVATAITPITTKGNAFFKGDKRFFIRGVDYQPGGSPDPIADEAACKRDVEKFKELNINTVRVYSVDPSKNHDVCMKALSDANIYLLLDVNSAKTAINRANPTCSYNAFYLKNVFDVSDAFSKYDNTLGYFAGNEVINDEKTTGAAKFTKAVIRDLKAYIKNHSQRQVPVGYSAADIKTNRKEQIEYFTCGDAASAADFWGHNDYSWCGDSDFTKSGYKDLVSDFKGLNIPIFFSEFGCNAATTRPFTEIKSIYSTDMSGVLSGGLVYEYSQEDNNYGLVKVSADGKSVETLDSFQALKSQYAATPDPSGDAGYSTSNKAPTCPAVSSTWLSSNDLPATPAGAKSMIEKGAGPIVSLALLGDTSGKCNDNYQLPLGNSTAPTPSNNVTTAASPTPTALSAYNSTVKIVANNVTYYNTTLIKVAAATVVNYNATISSVVKVISPRPTGNTTHANVTIAYISSTHVSAITTLTSKVQGSNTLAAAGTTEGLQTKDVAGTTNGTTAKNAGKTTGKHSLAAEASTVSGGKSSAASVISGAAGARNFVVPGSIFTIVVGILSLL